MRLSEAFSSYTTDGLAAEPQGQPRAALPAAVAAAPQQPQQAQQPAVALSPAAKEALLVVFSRKGSYVQVGTAAWRSALRHPELLLHAHVNS